jgi:hypothetical protein
MTLVLILLYKKIYYLLLHPYILSKKPTIAESVADILANNAPVNTGRLKDAITYLVNGDTVEVGDTDDLVYSDDDFYYWDVVINGRGPIYPVNAKALWWPGLPHPVKSAGPAEGQPFVDDSVGEVETMIESELDDFVSTVFGG